MSVWVDRRPGVADLLTLGNALCGVMGMFAVTGLAGFQSLAVDDRYRAAALLLVFGSFLDVIDGAAARKWGGTPLGAPLDCLADAVTFGVAPVFALLAVGSPGTSSSQRILLTAAGLAYVVAALVRLADFTARRRETRGFVGLPTTSACIGALSVGFLPLEASGLALGLLVLAVLMVSALPYPTGTQVVVVPIIGWVVGGLGILGVVDIRVCSVIVLIVICAVLPLATLLLGRRAATTPS